jgi:hypothetical protein
MTDSPPAPRLAWLAAAFILSFFLFGASHWNLPYDQVSLPNSLLGPHLVLVVAATAAARLWGGAGFFMATLAVGASAPAAVMARVITDTAKDPTSHNLWPFEFVLAAFVGLACATTGSLLATFCAMAFKRP